MIILAVIAQKGGTGKTTISLNLAVEAQLSGSEAAVLDMDPQGSASKWANVRRTQQDTEEPVVEAGIQHELARKLDTLREAGADIVIIDTPPASEQLCLQAARAADAVIVPVTPKFFSLQAMAESIDIINLARKPAYIVLNMMPPLHHKSRYDDAVEAANVFDIPVLDEALVNRIDIEDATREGAGISEYAPQSKAAAEMNALYMSICRRVDMSTSHAETRRKA